jgi:hypothetical protein
MPSAKASILPTRKALPANSESKRGGSNGSNEEETQDPASLVKSRKFGIKLQTKKTPPAAGEFEDAAPFWKAAKESLTLEGDNDDSTDGNNEEAKELVREQRRKQRAEQKNVSKKASRETLQAQYEEDRNNLKSPDFSLDASTGNASDIVARNVVGGRAKNVDSARSFRSRRRRAKKSPTEASTSVALFSPSEVSNVSTVAATHISTPASLRTVHSFPLSSSKSKGDTSRRKSETPLSDLKGRVLLQGMHSAMRRDTVQPRSIAEEEDSVESVKKVGNMDMTKILKNNDVINEEEADMDDNDLFPLDMEGGHGSFMTNDDDDSNDNDDNLILKGSQSNDRSSLSRAAGLLPTHVEENDNKDQESKSVRDTNQAIVERISSSSKAGEVTSDFEEEHRTEFDDDLGGEGYELPSDQESPPLQQEEETSRSVTFSKQFPLQDDNELHSEEEDLITKDGADANLKDKEDSETELNGSRSENVDATTAVTPDERQGKKRSRKRVTYARETFGYPAGNRDYKTIPVQDFVDSDENEGGHRPRRSKRVKVAPLEFWKNEKFVYEPNDETGRLGRILGDMPVVSGICMALPTPYKKRKLYQDDDGSERKKARKESKAKKVEISNEEFKPFNAIKLRKVSDNSKNECIHIMIGT